MHNTSLRTEIQKLVSNSNDAHMSDFDCGYQYALEQVLQVLEGLVTQERESFEMHHAPTFDENDS